MRPGYRRPRPRWRPRLASVWRAAPRDDVLLVLALCGAIACVVVALYLLGV